MAQRREPTGDDAAPQDMPPESEHAGHPLATAAGAGGGAATGAALGGAIGGPAGALVGGALGGAAGALAASSAAETLNPSVEDAYWREHYIKRPYADDTLGYDQYRPAYRYGWESRARFASQRWDEVERDLERGWREHRGTSKLGWSDAKLAARDAWQRVEHRLADERQRNA
ncbi:MAG: hypothetical protein WEF86_01435 [Gemmatimonadota bacterium]